VLCPFVLQEWDVDRMLNFEIADDPHYEGLELQVFDRAPGLAAVVPHGRLRPGASHRRGLRPPHRRPEGDHRSAPRRLLHRRRLVKYTAAPTAAVLNPAGDGPVATVDPQTPGNIRFDGPSNGIESLRARTNGHCAGLMREPAFPDVTRLRPGALETDAWRRDIDGNPAVVGGTWTVERRQDHITLRSSLTSPVAGGRGGCRRSWRPSPGSPLCSATGRRPTAGQPPSPSATRHC
jgi:hypothetical protein